MTHCFFLFPRKRFYYLKERVAAPRGGLGRETERERERERDRDRGRDNISVPLCVSPTELELTSFEVHVGFGSRFVLQTGLIGSNSV